MPARRDWTRNELLLALRLYVRTDFGKLHRSNPEIIALAQAIDRTPSAVAMKACNFASLDPALEQSGLKSTSRADRSIWQEFTDNPEALAHEAESAAAIQSRHHAPRDERPISDDQSSATDQSPTEPEPRIPTPAGPTPPLPPNRRRRPTAATPDSLPPRPGGAGVSSGGHISELTTIARRREAQFVNLMLYHRAGQPIRWPPGME